MQIRIPIQVLAATKFLRLPLAIGVPILVVCQLRKRRAETNAPVLPALPAPEESPAEDYGTEATWQDSRGSTLVATPERLSTTLLEECLDLDVRRLWTATMTSSAFAQGFQQKRKYRDINPGHWQNEGQEMVRRIEYVTPLKKNALGPKEAWCVERHTCLGRDATGFVVLIEAHTPKVPYGGSFHCRVLWVARQVSPKQTHLHVSGEVVFTKRCFVRGMVNRASIEGMQESYKLYVDLLTCQLPRLREQGDHPSDLAPLRNKKINGMAEKSVRHEDISDPGGFILQLLVTALLCLAIYMCWQRRRIEWSHFPSLPIVSSLADGLDRVMSSPAFQLPTDQLIL